MIDIIVFAFLLGLWACWILGSTAALSYLGFFSAKPLLAAPQRPSQFNLAHLAAVAMLYFCISILAISAFQALGMPLYSLKNSSSGAPATAPATTPATTAAATSSPATTAAASSIPATAASRPASGLDGEEFARAEALDFAIRAMISAVILLLAWRMVAGGLPAFGINLGKLPRGIPAGLLAGFLLVPWMYALQLVVAAVSHVIRQGPPPIHPILEALGENPSPVTQIILILAAVVAAPITEELFFRGLMQTTLLNYGRRHNLPAIPATGFPVITDSPTELPQMYVPPPAPVPVGDVPPSWRWITILITSLCFAAIHIGTSVESLPLIFLLSIALGYVYERTGNLWASITLHAAFNGISTILFLFFNT